jgi:hypothetical protein
MKDDDFAKHVTESKNDFADWVRDAVGDNDLAAHLASTQDKPRILELLSLRKENKPLPKLEEQPIKPAAKKPEAPENKTTSEQQSNQQQETAPIASKKTEEPQANIAVNISDKNRGKAKNLKEEIIQSQKKIIEYLKAGDLNSSIIEYKKLKKLCEDFPDDFKEEKAELTKAVIMVYHAVNNLKNSKQQGA